MFRLIRLPACPLQKVALILLSDARLSFCTTPFGPISITPPGVAEMAIAGTGVSFSPVVNGQGQCAESMLNVFGPEPDPRPLAACGYSVGPCLFLRNVVIESYVDVH